jgi:hypothetical protein
VLSNLFAKRSATIGEDHTATDQSVWQVLEESGGRLRLRTQETRYTDRLAIGSFLAFGVGDDGIAAPSLGKVARIHRPHPGVLVIDLTAFADSARPVEVRRAEGVQPQDEAVKALLVYDDNTAWSLLLPDDERFWEQTRILLLTGEKEMPLQLAELRDLGEDYCLFRLRANLGSGHRPHYPQATATSPEQPATLAPDASAQIPGSYPQIFRR